MPNWAVHSGLQSGHIVHWVRQPAGISAAHTTLLSPDILEVVGKRCAQISSVNSVSNSDANDVLSVIRLWEPEHVLTSTYVSGGPLLDAFLNLLVQGRTREIYPHAGGFPLLADLRNEFQAMSSCKSIIGDGSSYLERFAVVRGLSLFSTQEGYLGVGPPEMQQGKCIEKKTQLPMQYQTNC